VSTSSVELIPVWIGLRQPDSQWLSMHRWNGILTICLLAVLLAAAKSSTVPFCRSASPRPPSEFSDCSSLHRA